MTTENTNTEMQVTVTLADIFDKDVEHVTKTLSECSRQNVLDIGKELKINFNSNIPTAKLITIIANTVGRQKSKFEIDLGNRRVINKTQMYEEAMKPVRIKLTVLDRNLIDKTGDVFIVTNDFLNIKHFVPYGQKYYENGYHVPKCIYDLLVNRKSNSYLDKDAMAKALKGNRDPNQAKLQDTYNTYSITVLDPLTPEELAAINGEA